MACSAASDSHQALRGQILALRRLEFDRQLPNAGDSASHCFLGCANSASVKSDCFGYGWALGDAAVRPCASSRPHKLSRRSLRHKAW